MTLSRASGTPQLRVSTRFKAALLQMMMLRQGPEPALVLPPGGAAAPAVAHNDRHPGQAAQEPAPDIGHHGEGQSRSTAPRRSRRQRFRQGPGPHLLPAGTAR